MFRKKKQVRKDEPASVVDSEKQGEKNAAFQAEKQEAIRKTAERFSPLELWSYWRELLPKNFEKYNYPELGFLHEVLEIEPDGYGGTNRVYYYEKDTRTFYTKLEHWDGGNFLAKRSYAKSALSREDLVRIVNGKKNEIIKDLPQEEVEEFEKVAGDILEILLKQIGDGENAVDDACNEDVCGANAFWKIEWGRDKSDPVFSISGKGAIENFENINDRMRRTMHDPHNVGPWFSKPGFRESEIPMVVESVTIPEGITRIESLSFMPFKSLKTVFLPRSLEFVSESAFSSSCIKDILFYVPKGSCAEEFVRQNGWKYTVMD